MSEQRSFFTEVLKERRSFYDERAKSERRSRKMMSARAKRVLLLMSDSKLKIQKSKDLWNFSLGPKERAALFIEKRER